MALFAKNVILPYEKIDQNGRISAYTDIIRHYKRRELHKKHVLLYAAEWEKVWLSAHMEPFFLALSAYLTVFDKKYHILTCRDKRESYLIVLQQNNV